MRKNIDVQFNDINVKLEKITNYVKLMENKKERVSFIIDIFTIIIAAVTLVVSYCAMYTSNKLTTNNSALNFTYNNIDAEPFIGDEFNFIAGYDTGTKGVITIYIDTKVISGQIRSIYLISKKNGDFRFYLLNNEGIQDKYSGIKKYSQKILFDMEKIAEDENGDIGKANLYILSEDINGQVDIDAIQIVGPIILAYDEETDYTIKVDFENPEYSFRYLKNNKLITLCDEKDDAEWINVSDRYLEFIKETNIQEIEKDINMIKEKYSKY